MTLLAEEGLADDGLLKTLPFGVGLLLWDCIIACRQQPSSKWPTAVNSVIGTYVCVLYSACVQCCNKVLVLLGHAENLVDH